MPIYLGFSAVAAFVASFILFLTGRVSTLAVAHLVFAFGVMPLVFGAIATFQPVLTRTRAAHRLIRAAPLALQFTGFLIVLHFAGWLGVAIRPVAAGGALLVALVMCVWLVLRARMTLGRPHPGWRWYLAALASLALALAVVPLFDDWPVAYRELRLLHLHLNTLGFVGLAALGTLPVLLPTVLGGADPGAAVRLRSDLWPALGAVLAIAVGSGFSPIMAATGAFVLAIVVVRLGRGWIRRYGLRAIGGDGAAAPLAAALGGLLLLLLDGTLHAHGVGAGQNAVAAFVAVFLLPLVSGALTQLLPVWCWPGPRQAARDRMRAVLAGGGVVRALLFVSGGAAVVAGYGQGFWLSGAGLALFTVRLAKSLHFVFVPR